MIGESLALAAEALGVPSLEQVREPFPGGDRTLVVRACDGATSVVVKRYLDRTSESRHREPAALTAMAGHGAPRLLAEHATEPVVVMEDLGTGSHLAGRLLGADADAATRAVLDWAEALGRFHAAGRERVSVFESELQRRDPTTTADYLDEHLAESAADWPQVCEMLHVDPGPFEVLREVPGRWAREVRSISPNDTCPDNCIETRAGTVLLDLEHATVRHVAFDAAYLVAPWPTCWCAWGLPPRLADEALQAWSRAAGVVLDDGMRHDIDLAAATWHWLTVGWFAPGLLDGPDKARPGKPTPRRQDRLVRSLHAAARSTTLPELAPTAAALADAIEARWPAAPVLEAPAFR